MPTKRPDQTGEGLSREDLERLIEVIHQKGIEEFELEQGGTRVRIVAGRPHGLAGSGAVPAPAPVSAPPAQQVVPGTSSTAPSPSDDEDPSLRRITSPMVGTFYRAAAPGAKAFVESGDQVDEDTVLCIIEAMKLMNEIKAETRGVIRKILVENGQPVEYGQTLFLIGPG